MSKFTESDLLELFGVFDADYIAKNVAGSPQRFVRKWITRIRAAQESGIWSQPLDAATDYQLILIFAHSMTRHRFNKGDVLSLDRIGMLNALGSQAASGKFIDMQKQMQGRGIRVLEALISTNAWLNHRAEALETRRQDEEQLRLQKTLKGLEMDMESTQDEINALEDEMESMTLECQRLKLLITEHEQSRK